MSEAVSALRGVSWSQGIATVRDAGCFGMVSLRGDLSTPVLKKAVKAVSGLDIPSPLQGSWSDARGVVWMSPDEVLLIGPHEGVRSDLAQLHKGLGTTHALAVNVSDARSVFEVSGANARDVLAKLTPLDLAPSAFGPGDFRRTRLAQAAGAIWMPQDAVFRILCFRSVAQYMYDLLCTAAQPHSEVNYF